MLCITMQLDISVTLTPQVTTINLSSHEKNIIKKRKKIQKYGRLGQNPYVNKNDI